MKIRFNHKELFEALTAYLDDHHDTLLGADEVVTDVSVTYPVSEGFTAEFTIGKKETT